MSYYLYDVNGYVADGPSIQGLEDLAAWSRAIPAVQSFITQGQSTDLRDLADALASSPAKGSVDSSRVLLLNAVLDAKGILILSEGAISLIATPRAALQHPESAIHAVADVHLKQMTLAVMFAFLRGRRAYKTGGVSAAVKAVHDGLLRSLPPVLHKTLVAGGIVGTAKLQNRLRSAELRTADGIDIRFDATSEEAIQWAKDHAAELAKNLSATTEQAIKDAIANALEGDGIEGAIDSIFSAVGDLDRAELIARTEIMDAANEGLAQSWAQATEAGLLSGNEKKVWIATSGACEDCDSVDGEEVPMDDDFSIGDDPPAHPNCRCTMGLAFGGE